MEEDIHVRIEQPKNLRKQLLESALVSSEFLQTMEKIDQFEQERLQMKGEFNQVMQGLTMEVGAFIKGIPPLPMEFIQKQQQVLQRMIQPKTILTPRQALQTSMTQQQEVQRFTSPLEEEMAELKRRIKSLSV